MASKRWKGGAAPVAQVTTLTVGGTAAAGQVYTVTIGVRFISYTASGTDTNNTIAAALQALLSASSFGEFLEITWTVSANVITATAATAGVPFVFANTATGTGTLNAGVVTTSSSPNDISVGSNWDLGAVPAAGDDVFIDRSNIDIWWNLQVFNGVVFNSLTISSTFESGSSGDGTIGLPEVNSNGSSSYLEYRQQYLQCSPTTCSIGRGSGNGSGRIKLDFGAGQVNCTVFNSGTPLEANLEAVLLKGTNANNVITVLNGSVAIAPFGDDASTVATLNVGASGSPAVRTGPNCTLTTCNMDGGVVELGAAPTTLNKRGGLLTIDAGNMTTLNERGGVTAYLGSGTIGTLLVDAGGTVDFTQSLNTCTVTNASLYAGATVLDSYRTVTWSNSIVLSQCGVQDVTLDLGKNVSLSPVYL